MFCLFVLGFYGPFNNEVMSSRSVNSGTVPGQRSCSYREYSLHNVILKSTSCSYRKSSLHVATSKSTCKIAVINLKFEQCVSAIE